MITYKVSIVFLSATLLLSSCSKPRESTENSESNTQTQEQALIGHKAPDFTLEDLEGVQRSLSSYKGKYVVLEWINFDCPYVQKHYRSNNMQKLQKKYTNQGVIWLAVSSSAPNKQGNFPATEIRKRIARHKASHTAYLLDSEGELGKTYSAQTTPHMYIISPQGVLIYQGAIDSIPSANQGDIPKAKNYVALALDEAQAGKPLSHPTTVAYGCSVKY